MQHSHTPHLATPPSLGFEHTTGTLHRARCRDMQHQQIPNETPWLGFEALVCYELQGFTARTKFSLLQKHDGLITENKDFSRFPVISPQQVAH